MTNEELLVAMSDMMDQKLEEKLDLKPGQRFSEKLDQIFDEKLKPFDERLTKLELAMENVVVPGIQQLCAAYSSEYGRYHDCGEQYARTAQDVYVLKSVVQKHSEQIEELQQASGL